MCWTALLHPAHLAHSRRAKSFDLSTPASNRSSYMSGASAEKLQGPVVAVGKKNVEFKGQLLHIFSTRSCLWWSFEAATELVRGCVLETGVLFCFSNSCALWQKLLPPPKKKKSLFWGRKKKYCISPHHRSLSTAAAGGHFLQLTAVLPSQFKSSDGGVMVSHCSMFKWANMFIDAQH